MNLLKILIATLIAFGSLFGTSYARDQIKIVGSSTVYPYATIVAERFGKSGFKTPVIESTGTGGGMKLFCAGVGVNHPDITNASRVIKEGEIELCKKNGVTEIIEIVIGFFIWYLICTRSDKDSWLFNCLPLCNNCC